MRRPYLAALGIALVLAACSTLQGTDPSAPSSAATVATATATESVAPTAQPTVTTADAGERYLEIVAPFNAALCDYGEVARNPNSGRQELEPVTAQLADASRTFAEAALAATWPDETEDAMGDLVAAIATQEADLRTALGAADDAGFFANLQQADEARGEGSGAAQLVRITLGLEGIPTNACE